jgi:two-component system LytT family response regulator
MKTNNSGESENIRVLIVDDEPLARKRIRDLLREREEFEIVGECSNGKSAIREISANVAHLVFLDIQMQDMDGFEVLEKLETDLLPIIIFATAYDKYALKAFEVHAVDYLLKPFDDERFDETLDHVCKQIKKDKIEDLSGKLASLLADFKESKTRETPEKPNPNEFQNYQKRLVIKSTGKISFIEIDEIDWIGAEGSYISLNTNGKSNLMRGTLKKLEDILNPHQFLRIHRSTIVNVSAVRELKPHFHGEYVVILKSGKRLKLSRSYRESAEHLLGGAF